MKKLFTLSLLVAVVFAFNANAQSTRMVLAEEFTQASCPPCASQNPAFNALLEANVNKVCAIKYQTSWPGTDPMNANTQAMVGPRVTYYSVSGVPSARMDGVAQTGSSYSGAPANWTQTKLNTRAAIMSPFTLTLSHSIDYANDSIHITGNIECTQAVASTGVMVLHIAVVEHVIEFCSAPGTNGEKDFEGVMQLMLPSANGTTIDSSWTVGQQQAFSFNEKLPAYVYDKKQLEVVAFIQDNGTKEVHQAAISNHQMLSVDATLPCGAISNIPTITCGSGVTPSITIENAGSTNLTSLDITYDVDGSSPVTYPWTGNLASNSTAVVNIPTLTPAAGSHTLNVTISNPNGTPDLNDFQEYMSVPFNISTAMGVAPPLAEAFPSSVFPPAGWIVSNPDNSAQWARNSAGLNGAGSAKMDFWNSPSGQIDELYVPNYDFSTVGTTTATLEFDVAYAQYSTTTNDKIEVLYSTNCGQSWTSVFNEAGATLATGNAVATSAWTPSATTQWHHKTANLTGAVGQNNVFVKFKATSAYGNNAYIDNVNINTNMTVSVVELFNDNQVMVYPNPSQGNFKVQMNFDNSQDVTITVTNALGAVVKTMNLTNITSDVVPIDLVNAAKGTYEVTVKSNSSVVSKRIAITE